ncbi:hypothetical protein CBR_g38270 [Chara braunii]|uniref:Uncharacterized protein n=1 Tax=Chara braunii TaxID=69332 RepID=A0A388LPN1_CHABU|nr:hypothetical protein CBR_g38270 [Chara braunii]|eukprot:GBG84300.1 hypothetical protein CBR_g38270 [Chara braunii]
MAMMMDKVGGMEELSLVIEKEEKKVVVGLEKEMVMAMAKEMEKRDVAMKKEKAMATEEKKEMQKMSEAKDKENEMQKEMQRQLQRGMEKAMAMAMTKREREAKMEREREQEVEKEMHMGIDREKEIEREMDKEMEKEMEKDLPSLRQQQEQSDVQQPPAMETSKDGASEGNAVLFELHEKSLEIRALRAALRFHMEKERGMEDEIESLQNRLEKLEERAMPEVAAAVCDGDMIGQGNPVKSRGVGRRDMHDEHLLDEIEQLRMQLVEREEVMRWYENKLTEKMMDELRWRRDVKDAQDDARQLKKAMKELEEDLQRTFLALKKSEEKEAHVLNLWREMESHTRTLVKERDALAKDVSSVNQQLKAKEEVMAQLKNEIAETGDMMRQMQVREMVHSEVISRVVREVEKRGSRIQAVGSLKQHGGIGRTGTRMGEGIGSGDSELSHGEANAQSLKAQNPLRNNHNNNNNITNNASDMANMNNSDCHNDGTGGGERRWTEMVVREKQGLWKQAGRKEDEMAKQAAFMSEKLRIAELEKSKSKKLMVRMKAEIDKKDRKLRDMTERVNTLQLQIEAMAWATDAKAPSCCDEHAKDKQQQLLFSSVNNPTATCSHQLQQEHNGDGCAHCSCKMGKMVEHNSSGSYNSVEASIAAEIGIRMESQKLTQQKQLEEEEEKGEGSKITKGYRRLEAKSESCQQCEDVQRAMENITQAMKVETLKKEAAMAKLDGALAKLEAREREVERLQEVLSEMEDDKVTLSMRIHQKCKALTRIEEEMRDRELLQEALEEKIDRLTEEREELELELESEKDLNKRLRDEREQLEESMAKMQEEVGGFRCRLEDAEKRAMEKNRDADVMEKFFEEIHQRDETIKVLQVGIKQLETLITGKDGYKPQSEACERHKSMSLSVTYDEDDHSKHTEDNHDHHLRDHDYQYDREREDLEKNEENEEKWEEAKKKLLRSRPDVQAKSSLVNGLNEKEEERNASLAPPPPPPPPPRPPLAWGWHDSEKTQKRLQQHQDSDCRTGGTSSSHISKAPSCLDRICHAGPHDGGYTQVSPPKSRVIDAIRTTMATGQISGLSHDFGDSLCSPMMTSITGRSKTKSGGNGLHNHRPSPMRLQSLHESDCLVETGTCDDDRSSGSSRHRRRSSSSSNCDDADHDDDVDDDAFSDEGSSWSLNLQDCWKFIHKQLLWVFDLHQDYSTVVAYS